MLLTSPTPFLRRRSSRTLELMLASVDYVQGASVTLTFNQSIDITTIDPTWVEIDDPLLGHATFLGSDGPVTRTGAASVRINLDVEGPSSGTQIRLNASPLMRIKSAQTGQSWAGVSQLQLPYPS